MRLNRSDQGFEGRCEGRRRLGSWSMLWVLALGLWAVGEVDPSWATSPTDKADAPSDKADAPSDKAVAGRGALSLAPTPPPLDFRG